MKYEDLIKQLQHDSCKRILVTGPHRSGARIASKMIARDLDLHYIDEWDFFNRELYRFINMIKKNHPEFCAQGPSLSHMIADLPEDITII